MTQPGLQRPNVAHMVLKIPGRKGVPKSMQEPLGAVFPFRAFVSMPRHAAATIQPRLVGDALQLCFLGLVGPAAAGGAS